MNCPNDLFYTASHEWVRVLNDNEIMVGITDHAQNLLGELVFVELPALDLTVNAGEEIAVLESVKTAADVYSPLPGEVIAVNEGLTEHPNRVNQDPYGEGWLFKLKIGDQQLIASLISADSYQKMVQAED